MTMTNDDNTSNEAPTPEEERGYLLELHGMARANFRTLASLVTAGDIAAARAMIRAVKAGEAEDEGAAVRADNVGGETWLTGWVVRHLALALADHLDALPALNHCAWSINFPAEDERPARTLDIVAQWVGGDTTAERLGRAERERDETRAALAAAARGEYPRCRYCPGIATWMVREGSAERYCDKCFDAPSQDGDLTAWHQPAYAAAIRAAMGAK